MRPSGAYGLRLHGLDDQLLVDVSATRWPETRILIAPGRPAQPARRMRIDREKAEIPLMHGDRAMIVRRSRTATLETAAAALDGQDVHPFLSTVGVAFAWWDGRLAFHGGAFLDKDGSAWCLLGDRGSGKSSTLACLFLAGRGIVTDDLLVTDGNRAFAGPRLIDLRADTAASLGAPTVSVRAEERQRLALRPVPAETPIRGWVFLHWSDSDVQLRKLTPSDWLRRLSTHQNIPSGRSQSLVRMAGTEAWELSRPHTVDSLETTVERLGDLVDR